MGNRSWIEVQPAEMEVDGVPETFPVSITAGSRFDFLDLGVDTLGEGVG